MLTARLRRTTVLKIALPLLALDLFAAAVVVSSQVGLIICVIIGGLVLGVLNTVLTECVMEATDLPRSVASSAYSAVRFIGGAIAPPVATLLADAIAPSAAYVFAGHRSRSRSWSSPPPRGCAPGRRRSGAGPRRGRGGHRGRDGLTHHPLHPDGPATTRGGAVRARNRIDDMATANDRLVWIDCEMTGLDLAVDELVEVAVVITDFDLVPVHPGFDIVIKPDQSALDNMNEFVTNMHTTSGLIDEIPDGVSLADAEYQVLEYILAHVPGEGTAPLAGNTIGTDRAFLAKYMPRVDNHLHYRSVDVSSIKELCRRWFPRVYFNAPEKHGGHRALADILESIRDSSTTAAPVFVADPGPSTDDVRAVQAEVVAKWSRGSPSPTE